MNECPLVPLSGCREHPEGKMGRSSPDRHPGACMEVPLAPGLPWIPACAGMTAMGDQRARIAPKFLVRQRGQGP